MKPAFNLYYRIVCLSCYIESELGYCHMDLVQQERLKWSFINVRRA